MSLRRDNYEALFRNVITDGVSAGDFRPVDARLTAMAILSALNSIATWYSPEGRLTKDQVADQHADIFLAALASSPDPR